MEYKAKHKLWKELHSTESVEKDIELLREKKPTALSLKSIDRLLKYNKGRLEKEILYELLDVADEKEIVANRKKDITTQSENSAGSNPTVKEPASQLPAKKKSQKKKNTRR
jgi:hypothetical protein